MGGLFSSLSNSVGALRSIESALAVSQNNVSNASTPGYARQVAQLDSQAFNLSSGLSGGVQYGGTQSTQDEYANQAVRTQLSAQGYYTGESTPLATIQSLFDVTGQSGLTGSLNSLSQSFSAWAATPSTTSAQAVLSQAQRVAQSFQAAAASLSQVTNSVNQQISSNVSQINTLTAAVQQANLAIQKTTTPDAGLDANLHASLESLSQIADITVSFQPNGTATVLLGGQTPLVIGAQQYTIQASFAPAGTPSIPNATPDARILDASGQDITSQISQGSLGGLLNVRNTVLPALQGNGQQQGALNQLAPQVADRVNSILTSAQTSGGQAGSPLFAYNAASPADIAQTLTLDPNITAATLAPASPGPPSVSNGAALQLAGLGNSTAPADQISGQTILQYLSSMATQAGQNSSDAQSGSTLHAQLLAQSRTLQTQISGISLDAEAAQVLQLQQGYQAASKMVSVINTLSDALLNMT
ncbi:MAG: flagellar hook-associated protein FlgK [Acidobacteriota bacterium]|nr:flagellar hook-associated protein FlgK [Acidobacteriota bacterium]